MHICPAEIAAALIVVQQATFMYWYAKMRLQGFSEALKTRFSS